ncbi:MAG TPA: efflux RND transporter periplasmic adaptor subunit [Steroidobacteraceae bacterium]|nr:efflux RND transporter periplasmic adaptor subunit [Steroidobacteraceae bacterium]
MNSPQSSPPTEAAPANGKRKQRLLILGAVVLVAGVAFAAYHLFHGRFYESTDDAYVAADVMQITSEVAGTVTAVLADDTQHVTRGQTLVELDRADAEIAMAAAQAELARTVRQVRSLYSQADGLRAQIRERSLLLDAARADVKRREQAGQDGAVSAEEMQHVRDQAAQLEATLSATRDSLASVQAQIDNTALETHPQVLAASARVREAALALERTRILAPADGTVARRTVQIGTRIAPGAPLMAVVALSGAWVDANFKEVQLASMRVGQPVELHADVYGGSVTYRGRIAGLGAGSGSAFAVLPAQNASGNWIKIVQRVPVRIALDAKELQDHPLRVGLSMDVSVDLHDTSGPLLAQQVREAAPQLVRNDDREAAVTRQIASIIAANAGPREAGRTSL